MHINDLPHEIFSHIFTTISDDSTINPICLFPITNVCSRWRIIGLSTGNLWSKIAITYPLATDYSSCVFTLLVRSGKHPLDILMDLRDPDWEWNEDAHGINQQEMENIVMLLLPHAKRWRRIEILTDTWAPIFAFLRSTFHVEQVPMLKKLHLSRCNAYFAARGQEFQPASLSLPMILFGGITLSMLQSLALVGVHLNWDYFPGLPDLRLLEFKYHASTVMPNFKQFHSILNRCPMLSHLTIYGWGPTIDNNVSQDDRICLPNVTKLAFGVLDTVYTIMFLSLLDLPSLDSLLLEDVSRAVNPMSDPDTTLLLEWFCSHRNRTIMPDTSSPEFSLFRFPLHKIVSLELHEISTTRETFMVFLQEVPCVIRLGMYAMANEMLETIICSDPSEPGGSVVPYVRELDCQDMDPEVLLEVMASRFLTTDTFHAIDHAKLEYVRSAPPPRGSLMHSRLIGAGVEVLGDSDTN